MTMPMRTHNPFASICLGWKQAHARVLETVMKDMTTAKENTIRWKKMISNGWGLKAENSKDSTPSSLSRRSEPATVT
eukprot:3387712-Amphidinium_carterae.1